VLPGTNISFNSSIWEIYSLRSNSWRKFDVDMHLEHMDDEQFYMDREQFYMDGLSHWMCRSEIHNETYMLSFDWSNEVFLTTPLPSDMNDTFNLNSRLVWSHLVLLNGYVSLILNYTETATFHISILGELGVKESWTKIFIIGPLPCLEYPIGAGKKGDMLFRKKHGRLVWFDLNTQEIEELDGVFTWRFSTKILIHKESLLPF
jgi:F-box interacting protein